MLELIGDWRLEVIPYREKFFIELSLKDVGGVQYIHLGKHATEMDAVQEFYEQLHYLNIAQYFGIDALRTYAASIAITNQLSPMWKGLN